MAKTFCRSDHGPRKLRIATFCGLVFGSLSDDVPPIEEYLGEEVAAKIKRVLHKPVVVTGRFTQMLPNNWKLYFENVKDTYHASPAAHVLHDVPHQPAVAEGRHGGRARTAAITRASPSSTTRTRRTTTPRWASVPTRRTSR